MSSLLKARIAFAIAIGLLLACALVVYGTVRAFVNSQRDVERTQRIQVLLGDTEAAIASAARARLSYVLSGQDDALAQYQRAADGIPGQLAELRRSTRDNPSQQMQCDRLEKLVGDRIRLWQESIVLKQGGTPSAGQSEITRQSVGFADEIIAVTQNMRDEQSRDLQSRRVTAGLQFVVAIAILAVSFATAVWLLFWHHQLVREELDAREQAEKQTRDAASCAMAAELKARRSENAALASNEAARRLNARLLSLQDEERRRLSRELHDSTGQYLAAAKMLLAPLADAHPQDRRYSECVELLDRSLREIRTISHLLHPSGLEEAGFSVAARWYAEGFASRSGIELKIDIADLAERLPREIEITLFRVLQEALTNIHRHSGSRSAEISFRTETGNVVLIIADHGAGIAPEVLEQFRLNGASGVGLAGMRERIREAGGTFDIESNRQGTRLKVVLPQRRQAVFAAFD
jgi:signal transduction histidine kinase